MSDVSVSRTIAAPADQLYDIVSDLPGMGALSPENTGGSWGGVALGPGVGVTFKGENAVGSKTWSTLSTIEVADPGQRFEFLVKSGPMKISRWSYRFEPVGDGSSTEVTETWTDLRGRIARFLGTRVTTVNDRVAHNRSEMEQTLGNLAAAAES